MHTRELVIGYLKGLLKEWYLVAIAVFDFISMLIQPFLGFEIPIWVYLAIFGVVFVYANYLLYRDGRKEVVEIKELYEGKLTELQEKIAELQDRWPRLELLFHTDQGCTRHEIIHVSDPPPRPDLDALVRREAEQIQLASRETEESNIPASLAGIHDIVMEARTSLQRRKSPEEYEQECNAYLEQYRQYLVDMYNYELCVARFRSVRFAVQNGGKVPAENIVLIIHFPDAFYFQPVEERLLERPGERPKPPKRPTPFEPLFSIPAYLSQLSPPTLRGLIPPVADIGPSNVRGPFIKPEDSTEVSYEVGRLLHNFIEVSLGEVQFLVTDEAIGHSWELEYNIHAANLPKPAEGSVFLEVMLEDAHAGAEQPD
jgi:hypothetical protein